MIADQPGPPLGALDPSFDGATPDAPREARGWRGLLTWSGTSAPVALLLSAGIAFGPQGIRLLSPAVLALLDPVVPVALAAFGVLAGLSISERRSNDTRMLWIACLAAAVTMLAVSGGFAAVGATAMSPLTSSTWILILAAGVSAATSLTLPSANSLEPRSAATRVVELGVLIPIIGGGLILAWFSAGSAVGGAVRVAEAFGITLALAAAAWLLLTRASSETEERVFAVSALLLVGGVAAALSISALFGGLIAGVFWRFAGRRPRETISRDVLFVQHPLLVLVLLVAGARAELSTTAFALGAGYVALRIAGQVVAARLAQRAAGTSAPTDLARHLLAPGVLGIGFGLNAFSALGADASMMLAVVVIGTIGAELVAVWLAPRSAGE